jgi:hypothetical protein
VRGSATSATRATSSNAAIVADGLAIWASSRSARAVATAAGTQRVKTLLLRVIG